MGDSIMLLGDLVGASVGQGCVGIGLTELMNRPNMPPRAKPIVPAMTVLVGHDSNAACI